MGRWGEDEDEDEEGEFHSAHICAGTHSRRAAAKAARRAVWLAGRPPRFAREVGYLSQP